MEQYKPPVNYRSVSSKTVVPETFTVTSGTALIAEAPLKPTDPLTPVTVYVNGSPRTFTTGVPGPGQFAIQTQQAIDQSGAAVTVYLPILLFDASDEGLDGTVDYWRTGTIYTSQFFAMLVRFLTPLTNIASIGNLPPATTDVTVRGHAGDLAFLSDGTFLYSDGFAWNQISGGGTSSLIQKATTLATVMGMAMDAGYALPAFPINAYQNIMGMSTDAVQTDVGATTLTTLLGTTMDGFVAYSDLINVGSVLSIAQDAVFTPPGSFVGDLTVGGILGLSMDSVFTAGNLSGSLTLGQNLGITLDATFAAGGGGTGLPITNGQFTSDVTVTGQNPTTRQWTKYTNDASGIESPYVRRDGTALANAKPAWLSNGDAYCMELYAQSYGDQFSSNDCVASLYYNIPSADFTTGSILTFDCGTDLMSGGASSNLSYVLLNIGAFSGGLGVMNNNATVSSSLVLFASRAPSGIGTLNGADTTYYSTNLSTLTTISFDLKAWVTARLQGGKTWANVQNVIINPRAYSNSFDAVNDCRFFINNFR